VIIASLTCVRNEPVTVFVFITINNESTITLPLFKLLTTTESRLLIPFNASDFLILKNKNKLFQNEEEN